MAYHDENGKITIDEQAANKDVKRLQEATQILTASRDAIRSLQRQAGDMQGSTANAIVLKAQQMEKRLNDMIEKLESTGSYIKKVVRRYELLDEQIKQAIQAAANVASAVTATAGVVASTSGTSISKTPSNSALKGFGDAVDDTFDDFNFLRR